MRLLKNFGYRILYNLGQCFHGLNLIWQGVAFFLTYFLVVSGFDWRYFRLFSHGQLFDYLFAAAIVGFLFPMITPIVLLIIGEVKHNQKILNACYAFTQANFLGWCLSSFYKAFTGRSYPPLHLGEAAADISRVFNFGILQKGIFWGWPSSHTTVAFAGSVALIVLFPKNNWIKVLALIYAFYVGIGVSVSIHWFSDFVAGAIIGSVIGWSVGKSFKHRIA